MCAATAAAAAGGRSKQIVARILIKCICGMAEKSERERERETKREICMYAHRICHRWHTLQPHIVAVAHNTYTNRNNAHISPETERVDYYKPPWPDKGGGYREECAQ